MDQPRHGGNVPGAVIEIPLIRGAGRDGALHRRRPLYRKRQLRFDPKGFCQWGSEPQIREFR